MGEDGRVRHEYYKGLRVIRVSDSREFVAWDEIQIGFRGEGDEVLPEDDYDILRILLRCYIGTYNLGREFRDLQLGCRFYNQRYGFSFKPEPDLKDDQFVPFVKCIFEGIMSLDTPEKMRSLLNAKTVKKLTPEDENGISIMLVEEMNRLRPELENFIKMIDEENRYVIINQCT